MHFRSHWTSKSSRHFPLTCGDWKIPGRIRSIPWLLMPWHLVLLGHQQHCYSLCRINVFLSSARKYFCYLRKCLKRWRRHHFRNACTLIACCGGNVETADTMTLLVLGHLPLYCQAFWKVLISFKIIWWIAYSQVVTTTETGDVFYLEAWNGCIH